MACNLVKGSDVMAASGASPCMLRLCKSITVRAAAISSVGIKAITSVLSSIDCRIKPFQSSS